MSEDKDMALPTDRATTPDGAEPVVSGKAGIPSAKVLIFADDPERKPRLYACAKCGSVHSPEIYLAKPEVKHAAALEAAENCYSCRTHDECKYCGCETPKGWLACADCRLAKALEKAEEVPDDGGPYCEFDGDRYFTELDEAADAGLDWVSPCTVTYPRIDGDDILDGLLSDMHEDASIDDLEGVDAFMAAVAAFNEAQTQQTWFGDNKRKIRVPAQAIEARRAATLGAVHESAVRKDAPEAPHSHGDTQ